MNKRHYEHTLPNIRGSLSNTYSFFIKTGFSFVKNSLQSRLRPGCTHHGDPGAGEVQTRVCARPLRGCGDVYPPC